MKKLIYLIPLAIFAIMVGFFMVGLERDPRLIPSPFIDKPAPAMSAQWLLDSERLLRSEDLKGKVTLVNFWATWCPTCKGEHDVLMEVARTENAIRIIGVDYKDTDDAAKAWLTKLGDPYETVVVDRDGKIGIDWGVYGTPETFILDANGVVRYKHVGAISWQDWTQTLQPIVNSLVAAQ